MEQFGDNMIQFGLHVLGITLLGKGVQLRHMRFDARRESRVPVSRSYDWSTESRSRGES